MFDAYRQENNSTYVSVQAKPHDTADAARLYGELKTKAEDEVADAVIMRLGAHNELKVVCTQYRFDTDAYRVLFDINGIPFDIVVSKDRLALSIHETVAKALADMILHRLKQRPYG